MLDHLIKSTIEVSVFSLYQVRTDMCRGSPPPECLLWTSIIVQTAASTVSRTSSDGSLSKQTTQCIPHHFISAHVIQLELGINNIVHARYEFAYYCQHVHTWLEAMARKHLSHLNLCCLAILTWFRSRVQISKQIPALCTFRVLVFRSLPFSPDHEPRTTGTRNS